MAELKLNGYTLADARVTLISPVAAVELVGISTIDMTIEQPKSNSEGTGRLAVSRGRGSKSGSGSLEIELGTRRQILDVHPLATDLCDIPPFVLEIVFENTDGGVEVNRFHATEFTNDGLNVGTGGDTSRKSLDVIYAYQS